MTTLQHSEIPKYFAITVAVH